MNKHGRMGKKMSRCLFQVFALLCALAASSAPAASLYFVHTDHLGTPQKITDSGQQVVWEGSPMPFGETEVVVNQIDFHVRFPGQYFDGEAGLHYNYFRDYDPGLGRYIQSDPIGLDGGLNTYSYAYQTPLSYTDPKGLTPAAAAGLCFVPGVGWVGCGVAAAGVGGAALLCYLSGACQNFADACGDAWNAMNESSEGGGDENDNSDNQRGNPYNGEPGEWVEHPHGKQDRLYGNDGTPAVDIDYGHDHGQGSPHAHNWEDGVRGPGVPVSPVE